MPAAERAAASVTAANHRRTVGRSRRANGTAPRAIVAPVGSGSSVLTQRRSCVLYSSRVRGARSTRVASQSAAYRPKVIAEAVGLIQLPRSTSARVAASQSSAARRVSKVCGAMWWLLSGAV